MPTTLVAAEPLVQVGSGSFTTVLPKGAKAPPETIYRTENLRGPMPTNDWWSSVAWLPYSERHYPHPLAVEAGPGGLRVYYPGNRITANKTGIFGFMPAKTGDDLILGHSEQTEFADARVDAFSDWFVTVRFGAVGKGMKVSYGHGSPFVYALHEGGTPRLTFARPPQVWFGDEASPVLGITVNGTHYGLFGPSGSTWKGLKDKTWTIDAAGKPHFSLAVLPDNAEKTLALFRRHAYTHVTDSQVDWSYDPGTSSIRTTFMVQTKAHEGASEDTLLALYPHQWRSAAGLSVLAEYPSVRGKMKLIEGKRFQTVMRFPGVLPAMPNVGATNKERMGALLKQEAGAREVPLSDTYADGKWLGKLATLAAIADEYGQEELAGKFRDHIRKRLEQWFSAAGPDRRPKDRGLFYHDGRWGTLIGYPASFGSDTELNDHHFHYGYFIQAGAEVARHDLAWAKDDRWGGMVKLLIRDIASGDRKDGQFPFLRNFDPYAGHSWASGHAKFGDGNNHESSSEAMNAWTGLILWGEATGNTALRDLGIWLYTTEMSAINEYWFDVHGENFPRGYTPSVVTMVWGGKGANATWFSADPAMVHGINWLPLHGGSLYLGHYPAYVEKNYAALVKENGGTSWKAWADIIWMVRALADPKDAITQFEAAQDRMKAEAGNSKAHTYHWLYTLDRLGQVDAKVVADRPLHAVFRKANTRTYCTYNPASQPRTVVFSDGFRLEAKAKSWATGQRQVKDAPR
jgi:endoglucanase Acf2